MSIWEVQNDTEPGKGYLTLTCDGKRVCDFFPFAKDANPDWVKLQAYRIRDRMRGGPLIEQTDTGSEP
jgi:hypothetical protein